MQIHAAEVHSVGRANGPGDKCTGSLSRHVRRTANNNVRKYSWLT